MKCDKIVQWLSSSFKIQSTVGLVKSLNPTVLFFLFYRVCVLSHMVSRLVPLRRPRALGARSVIITSASIFWYVRLFRIQISSLTSSSSISWSQYCNSFRPWRASARWPVTTHEAFQLSIVDRVGSCNDKPTLLTGIQVTFHPDICFPSPG